MAEEKIPQQSQPLETRTTYETIKSWLPIVLVCLGIFILGASLVLRLVQNQRRQTEAVLGPKEEVKADRAVSIKVDVSGAVEKPGVYQLPVDSRIADALILAGGLTEKADRNYLSKYINLAQIITDAQKVYIPFQGENFNKITNPVSSTIAETISKLININTASKVQLESLPGIGPVTAEKIIDGRLYQLPEDLLNRKIVGRSVYQKIKDKITTNLSLIHI